MPQVDNVMRITAPYKFVSKEFRKGKTRIKIAGTEIGGDEFVVIAGPCSVECEEQIMRSAEGVAKAGAKLLRGGAYKPRTSPYDFQGMEEEGLKLLQKAKKATGLGIVTEVMGDRDVELVAQYTDVMQVGARNMQNFMLSEGARKMWPAGSAEARSEQQHQRIVDERGIYRGAWESRRDLVRARHPHIRDGHAQHMRHFRDSRAQ